MKKQKLKNFVFFALFMIGAVGVFGQTDVTDTYLKNPSFEDNFTNWTNDGFASQTNTSFTIKEGSVYAEQWVYSGGHVADASLSQTVTSLANGVYKLTVAAQNIQQGSSSSAVQTGVYVFANDQEVEVNAAADYSVTFTVIDGEATVGFKAVNATGNWISCDNFRLYSINNDLSSIFSELQRRIDEAKELVDQKMQASLLSDLNTAIKNAENEISLNTGENVTSVAKALSEAIAASKVSVDAYAKLQSVVDEAVEVYGDGDLEGADSFDAAIQKAKQVVEGSESTPENLSLALNELEDAILIFRVTNASGETPTVETYSQTARGATMMFGRSTVTVPANTKILEQGFCWSTNPEPTIFDNRTTEYLENNGKIYVMRDVEPSTIYYVRAYAITDNYAVGYGDVRKIITLPKGGITYGYDNGGPADANQRISEALASAVGYWNDLTSIKGLYISCHYGSGTPTADCSYGGWMRVGPNSSYQRTGTIMHEMGHAVGVGTHSIWQGPNSPLRSGGGSGNWLGDRVTQVLRFWDNDPSEMLQGDGTHMWPYGVNGSGEDNGTEVLYIGNGLITQALGEDGLPPTGGFCTPAYVFDQDDNKKYYIKTESEAFGRNTTYLIVDGTVLKTKEMSVEEAENDDNAAWNITFDPETSYYQLRNVGTGRYITYSSVSFGTSLKDSPEAAENIHLMRARVDAITSSDNQYAFRGYWIIHPENVLNPATLAIGYNNRVTKEAFDLSDNAEKQRWIIIGSDELQIFDSAVVGDAKEKALEELDQYKKLIETPHSETEDGVDQAYTECLSNTETQINDNDLTVVDITNLLTDLQTSAMSFLEKVVATDDEQPFDLTFLMSDPSLTTAEGWSTVPTISYSCGEFYQTTYDFNQTIENLPKGTYRFNCQAFQRPGDASEEYYKYINGTDNVNAQVYAGSDSEKMQNIASGASTSKLGGNEVKIGSMITRYVPDNMEAASLYFAKGLYQNDVYTSLTENGSLKVGIKCSQASSLYWTIFDNFHLYFYGEKAVSVSEIKNSSTPAEVDVYSLTGVKLKSGVKAENALDGLTNGIYIVNGQKVRK